MATALQLVNRVLRKMSEEDVTTFNSQLSKVVLDAVNEAKHEVLDVRSWPFLFRSDGILTTVGSFTGTTASFTNASTAVSFPTSDSPNSDESDIIGTDKVSRIVNTEDSTYGETSLKIVSGADSGGTFSGTLEANFPGTTGSGNLDYRVFAAEYLLPNTVASVESVLIEEDEIALEQIDEAVSFDDAMARYHWSIAEPRVAMVGGVSVASYDSATSAPDPLLRLILWPVPDDEYVVRYKYRYRYADLSAITDEITGVPEYVPDLIVTGAFRNLSYTAIGNDPDLGDRNASLMSRSMTDYMRDRPDGGRRLSVPSLDNRRRSSRGAGFGRLPRNFGSI